MHFSITHLSLPISKWKVLIYIIAFASKATLTSSYSFLGQQPLRIPSIHLPSYNGESQPYTLSMKVSKGKSKHSKGNSIHTLNQQRKRLAGKPGTKHFQDPNKLFIGNLPFKATQQDVEDFLRERLGNLHNVQSVKIVKDWKTGISKGYGFVQFMDPICATSALESIKGKKLMGRVIRLDQGKRKESDENRILFMKRRERKSITIGDRDTEEGVINSALDEVDFMDSNGEEDEEVSSEDFDDDNDDLLFEDDDDDEFDGWFEEVYGGSKWEVLDEEEAKNMNREQRREAQRMKPRKKLPSKGFGTTSP